MSHENHVTNSGRKVKKNKPPDCPLDERYAVQAEALPHQEFNW